MAALANIRHIERERLRGLLLPGYIVQVCGPPMVGKLTVVNQVLRTMESTSRLQASLSSPPLAGPFIFHRFSCKHAKHGLAVLTVMAAKLACATNTPAIADDLGLLTATVQARLKSVLQQADEQSTPCHHILVFEKCETLLTNDADAWFLGFVSELMRALSPDHLVTVVFTSYKRFEWSGGALGCHLRDRMVIGPIQDGDGHVCCTLEVEQLVDADILCLLQHFAPDVNPSPYLHVFQRFLGFPEAVRKVAQNFLLAAGHSGVTLSSETLEHLVKTDVSFLHSVFSARLQEVIDWVGWNNLLILRHLGSSMDCSATRECFQSVFAGDNNSYKWPVVSYHLERFYVIRELPGVQRFVVHPLVIFFCWTELRAILVSLRGRESNLFSNRFTHFLCATLSSLDACRTSLRGRQLAVVSSMLYECPNIRHVITMALLASEDSYGVYLKLAISGAGMLSLLCPREAVSFFLCLSERSHACGRSLTEQAILRGLYGQALGQGSGTASVAVASGRRWQESTQHLSEAIDILSRPGIEPSYYLLLFLMEKAKILSRQGRYDESLRCFKRARRLFGHVRTNALGEDFAVTERKLMEIELITCVYETVPLIFKGNNALARDRLTELVERLEQDFPNSLELPTAHNQLGLCEQRGRLSAESSEKAKISYWKCLRLRTYFQKINPIPLYAPLNNVAMLSYRSNDLGQFYSLLEKALQISRQFDWMHYYTGLTLIHLAEGSIGLGHFKSALLYLKEAERVLSRIAKDHDLRLRALLELAHVTVALRPSSAPHQTPQLIQGRPVQGQSLPSDGDLVPSAVDMCRPVSDSELNTPIFYLDRLSEAAKDMQATLSDDGHHYLLSAYEHALLLNWKCIDSFELFRSLIFEHVERNKFLVLFHQENPNKYHNVHKHKDIYLYLKECFDNGLEPDLQLVIAKQVPACTICRYGKDFFTEDMWFMEINALIMARSASEDLRRSPPSAHSVDQSLAETVNMNSLSQAASSCSSDHLRTPLPCHRPEAKVRSIRKATASEQAGLPSTAHYNFAGLSTNGPYIPVPVDGRLGTRLDNTAGELVISNQSLMTSASSRVHGGLCPNSLDMYVQQGLSQGNISHRAGRSSQERYREPIELTEPAGQLLRCIRRPVEDEEAQVTVQAEFDISVRGTSNLNSGLLPFQRSPDSVPVENSCPLLQQPDLPTFPAYDGQYQYNQTPYLHDASSLHNIPCDSRHSSFSDNSKLTNSFHCANFNENFPYEKVSQFEKKDVNLQQGLKELTLSEDHLMSSTSSSGLGSMTKSTTGGFPSVPGSFLSQSQFVPMYQSGAAGSGSQSLPGPAGGARPKTTSSKRRNKSEKQ